MQLVRTTIRLSPQLKKTAELLALEEDTSFQEIVGRAIAHYADDQSKKKAKKITFITHDLGVPLDNLTRSDYYDEPNFT